MLKLHAVSHRYGEQSVLENVSLELKAGQRLALMGPSGCGKTTFLRIALGLQCPSEGQVLNTFSKTGVVFQEPRLLPWRTAAENVNLVLGDKPRTLSRVRAYLAGMELEESADKYPRELSGGMQQRVSLARALAVEPDLLVLDEPFRGLDEELKQRVLGQVNKTSGAILLVTHDIRDAEALGCEIRMLP